MTGYVSNIQRYSIHDGPGIRTTVFLKGCPLRCGWCSNPETQKLLPEEITDVKLGKKVITGEEKTVEDVMKVVRRDKVFYDDSNGGVTLSGGEVLMQPEFARAILDAAHSEGIHTTIGTTGYANPETITMVTEAADLILYDLKGIDDEKHRNNTGVSNERILSNLSLLMDLERNVIVRIPVIPRHNATVEELQATIDFAVSLGIRKIEMLPYHRMGESKYSRLERNYEWHGVPTLTGAEIEELYNSLKAPENVALIMM